MKNGSSEMGRRLPAAPALSGPAKALLALMSLEENAAVGVLSQLSEDEVLGLKRATEEVRSAPPESINSVMQELARQARSGLSVQPSQSERFLRDAVRRAFGDNRAAEMWREQEQVETVHPGVAVLRTMDEDAIASVLVGENAQTIAVILSQLSSERAARLLQRTKSDVRGEVMVRLARLKSVPEDVLDTIVHELRQEMPDVSEKSKQPVNGPNAAAAILKRLTPQMSSELLQVVSNASTELAGNLQRSLFGFEDLLGIDAKGIQQVLKEVDTAQLAVALKNASPELKRKLMSGLSSRAALMLQEEIQLLGPTRISEVEEAQQGIVERVLKLEKDGKIIIVRDGDAGYV